MYMFLIFRRLSAWVPIAMSSTVILMFAAFFFLGGPLVREPDEGFAAHMFQILMGLQVPIIAYFALKWLPERPQEAIQILVLQLIAGILAAAPVFILQL